MILRLLNHSGGAGRTALALHLAEAMAERRHCGRRVLAVDSGAQAGGRVAWRPADPESRVRAAGTPRLAPDKTAVTARLAGLVSPEWRGCIEGMPFRRAQIVAAMLRGLLGIAFAADEGGRS